MGDNPAQANPESDGQPHPNPRLAALGRITPSPGNPKGYPPFNLAHVAGYTNNQLVYYLQTHQVPDLVAFQKAKKARDELLRSFDHNGESDEEQGRDTPATPTRTTRSSTRLSRASVQPTIDDDSEPDEVFPQPEVGEKGLKIDKITTLRHNGGLINYRTWLKELGTVFKADPSRFNTAEKRIAFASIQLDDKMKALWTSESHLRPYLESHWKKFARWVAQAHLHGEADHDRDLQQYHEAKQGENEEPTAFYSRLLLLAIATDRQVDRDDLFPRLVPGLRTQLTRTHRKGDNVTELLNNAQEIWGTFAFNKPGKRKHSEETSRQGTTQSSSHPSSYQRSQRYQPPRGRESSTRQAYQADRPDHRRLSEEERVRRRENHLCLKCGQPGHFVADCTRSFQPGPPSTIRQPPNDTSATTRAQPALQRTPYRGSFRRTPSTRVQPIAIQSEDRVLEDGEEQFDPENDEFDEDGPSAAKYSKNY